MQAAANAQCVNNLKQIGLAIHSSADTNKHLPTAGDNGAVTLINGTPATPTSTPYQRAGVLFQILPFIDQDTVYSSGNTTTINSALIKVYFCPSRRPPTLRNNTAGTNPQGLTDYVVPIHGIDPATGNGNCWGLGANTNANGVIVRGGNGAATQFPPGKIPHVTDGMSNTIMMAEGALSTTHYIPPPSDNDFPPPEWVNSTTCNGWSASRSFQSVG